MKKDEINPLAISTFSSFPAGIAIKKYVKLPIITLILCGCSSQWVASRPGAEALSSARPACETQSEKKFPVKNEVAQRTVYSQKYETCKKNEECDGKKYKTTERPETESYVMDVNKDSRRNEFYGCMSVKGWEYETKWF
ncbi:hypothetical protein [Pantoea sp. BAV 3049]|uniref:hypothetical protein n=1 Tax=Pantoea sp. BAV 3049 TaxID=2654188 RepID=UPI001E5B4185|nr:hypothetical protein [Pantoea sp. BAV 3049]